MIALKQVSGSDLVRAVRTLAAGGSLLDPGVIATVLARLRRGGGEQDPLYAHRGRGLRDAQAGRLVTVNALPGGAPFTRSRVVNPR
jgi:DNA-binding NarL/FixJ family response regulator